MRKLVMILAIAAITVACSDFAQAELDIPASGTFDIVIDPCGPPGVSFDAIPCTGSSVYLWPFASEDGSYTPPYLNYNLAEVSFSSGSIIPTDKYEQTGDLGIRIANISGDNQTFNPSVLTLDFVEYSFDVYLPGFTIPHDIWKSLFFWVAQSGATYYAHSSTVMSEDPDMSADVAMRAGNEYLTPEPTTAALLSLGAVLLRRRRRFLSGRL